MRKQLLLLLPVLLLLLLLLLKIIIITFTYLSKMFENKFSYINIQISLIYKIIIMSYCC